MSAIEQECRWSIVCAYMHWRIYRNERPYGFLAYVQALGLEA